MLSFLAIRDRIWLPVATGTVAGVVVGAIALGLTSAASTDLSLEKTVDRQAAPELVGPPVSYPRWTHKFLFEGHFTFVSGKDAVLTALMDSQILLHGAPSTLPMDSSLEIGDIAFRGGFENVGDEPAILMDSYGEMIELDPGMRIVVSDQLLYGATEADRATGAVPYNACICDCGDYIVPQPVPGGQQPPRCGDYNDRGPCIDRINNARAKLTNCVPGYHAWSTETNDTTAD